MDSKMERFLKSLDLDIFEFSDLSFDMVLKNRLDHKTIDMAIVKDNPWDYFHLSKFMEALNSVSYPYTIRFSYKKKPNGYDAIRLYSDWYSSIYHLAPNIIVRPSNDNLTFVFESEEEQRLYEDSTKDFASFLQFINYRIELNSVIEIKTETGERASEEEILQTTEEALKIINKQDDSDDLDLEEKSDYQALEQEHFENQDKIEASLLKEMKANLKRMKEERRMRSSGEHNYELISHIAEIDANIAYVDFDGSVFSLDKRPNKAFTMFIIGVGDDHRAIYVKANSNRATIDLETISNLKKKSHIRVRGRTNIDKFNGQLEILADYIDLLPPLETPKDKAKEKRVELHLHTRFSAMDGISDFNDYLAVAEAMGHKAIAITDHGVVQGFLDADKNTKGKGIKVIYGSELYMVEDLPTYIFNPHDIVLNKAKYVFLDLETTGLSSHYDGITEFGAVKFEGGMKKETLDILINPEMKIPPKVVEKTGITDAMVKNAPKFNRVVDKILSFLDDAVLVTHNASFDISFLNEALKKIGYKPLNNPVIDTLELSRYIFKNASRHNLGALARNLDVAYDKSSAHRAEYDASVLADVWFAMLNLLTKDNPHLMHSDLAKLETSKETLSHLRPEHVTVLVKNEIGLKNLYKLISLSHTEYFARVPRVPRSVLEEHREGLLIGSACFNSEIFELLKTRSYETLVEAMSFYDFIEVQPPQNYSYLLDVGDIVDEERLIDMLKTLVRAGKEANKIVCATGDCHYSLPNEKIYRDVIILAKGVGKTAHPLNQQPNYDRDFTNFVPFNNPDQHYRSTDEMFECFNFLDEETAEEIIVENTNKIADMIEVVHPLREGTYPPKIEGNEQVLTDLVYKNFYEKYGENPPEFLKERLKKELDGIISNGYSVNYYLAYKIVHKANSDGYIVGSRGSVGSSFVAMMADITEVNPLPPHYLCPNCHRFELSSDPNIRSGFDLPPKRCPACGTPMIADGQNIPFETFLGFNADKVPDIDLNFPGDYQARAFEYVRTMLGKDNTFRCGTISTVKDQTAYAYARDYAKAYGLNDMSQADISMLASGCLGVKHTTGQHPGGVIIVPTEYEVYDFTPVQFPADDLTASWRTTHFDYRSMHDNLLKLDLLGHQDPIALKMMTELTHIPIEKIPLNDLKVLSCFSSNKALNLSFDYLGEETGALGLPEFGTGFVRGILKTAKPKSYADLIAISGLSHGTGVWQGNAEDLLKKKVVNDIKDVIGCRDDIMTYLIQMGLPANLAFSIMEDVRKGRGLKKEFEDAMRAHGVPNYYIDSCNKIQYMFPKAHATAYVTMAIRVCYFKLYYPLEYYATFFSIRSDQYDIESMVKGKDAIIDVLDDFKRRKANKEKLSTKEDAIQDTLEIAIEMIERGYTFSNISLEKSDASNFVCDHENKCLIPPFKTIEGLGENAASSIIEARNEAPFTSKEDLLRRTKLNNTNVERLAAMHVLDNLPESEQLSLFDFSF